MEILKKREVLISVLTIRIPERLKSKVDQLKDAGLNSQEWLRNLIERELENLKIDQK